MLNWHPVIEASQFREDDEFLVIVESKYNHVPRVSISYAIWHNRQFCCYVPQQYELGYELEPINDQFMEVKAYISFKELNEELPCLYTGDKKTK